MIGRWGLLALCVNSVVGSGVFLLPSETYAILGPLSLWAPIVFALPVFILVLCFAEAASHFREPGGPLLYAGTAFGDFVGFQTGWMNWLARITSVAALANGFVLSLGRLWPAALEAGPRAALLVGSIGLLSAIHVVGVRHAARTIYVLTIAKLVPLVLFIVVALVLVQHNPVPASLAIPKGDTDWSGAALFMLFAYAGFENLGVAAGEYKRPRRDLPLALLAGILVVAVIYALTQFAAMASLPDLGGTGTPIADAAGALMGPFGAWLISIGAIVSILGTSSGTILEGSRTLYALTTRRRRYRTLSAVHPRFHTPATAIIVHAVVASLLALGGSFAALAMLSSVARMTTYLVTPLAVPRLRRLSEGFRTPGLWIPALGTLIALALFVTLRREHILAAGAALVIGAALWALGRMEKPGAPASKGLDRESDPEHDPAHGPAAGPTTQDDEAAGS